MKLTLTALTIAATMFASSASAADPADPQKLISGVLI
jgi:ABC-type transporter MlaC component